MRYIIAIMALVLTALTVSAQKAEILYFKADLPCCQATACDNVESTVKGIIEANFNKKAEFKQVKLAEVSNSALVKKHKAKSQTVIVSISKKGKESNVDVSEIIRSYTRDSNKEKLEKDLVAKINETLK